MRYCATTMLVAITSLLKRVSLDKVGATVVVAGCLAILIDADQTGRTPLMAETPAYQCPRPSFLLSKQQYQQLSHEGYLIVDNFLTKQQIREACHCIQQLDASGKFQSSPNEQEQQQSSSDTSSSSSLVRTDRIYMCRHGDSQNTGLSRIHDCLAQFARSLTESDFDGFHDDYKSNQLHVPAQMQVSIYGGGALSQNDFYTSHLDSAEADSFIELGLLGWLRSQYLRKRYLTCIVYLNEDWREEHGGCLRLHKNAAQAGSFDSENYIDVAPVAGRLVVFSSLNQWHAVLPTSATRYACSLWLTLNKG